LPQLGGVDSEMRRIEFLKLLRQAPEVTDVAQLDAQGLELIAISRLGLDVIGSKKDRSTEAAFTNSRSQQIWFSPVYFRKETEPYMTIAVRSTAGGATTIAEVNLKFIWDVVTRIRIGEKGKAYVVDASGHLVADPDISLVLRKTNLGELAQVKAALTARGNDAPALLARDHAGTEVLASFAPIGALDWRMFVEQPVAEVYAKLYDSIKRTVLLLLAGLAVSALAALALARGMVRPIRVLDEGARRIASGNLEQQILVRTGDELEGLAAQFNQMTAELRESYTKLEQRVDERTRELAGALERQRATAEVLQVLGRSMADATPVFDAIANSAKRLFDATDSIVTRVVNDQLELLALSTISPERDEALRRLYPMRQCPNGGLSSRKM
jgi:methyl-accepting chemotaxis protein